MGFIVSQDWELGTGLVDRPCVCQQRALARECLVKSEPILLGGSASGTVPGTYCRRIPAVPLSY
jgi:hypothetical protein